jgi:hypothetical protein
MNTKVMNNALRQLRSLERGDGGSFGHTLYLPYLFLLVVFGLTLSMVGVWRVGTVAANERGAYVASVTMDTSTGSGTTLGLFPDLTSSANASGVNVDDATSSRTVVMSTQADENVDLPFFGSMQRSVIAQSQKRFERFYAGPAECAGGVCEE